MTVQVAVLDKDIAEPPADPAVGDAYIVATGGTDDWLGWDGDVAVYTARGWSRINLAIGQIVYVRDEDRHYHRNNAGVLVATYGLTAGTIPPSALVGGSSRVITIVENQITNTPPSIVEGVNYVIGSSPTGRWTGQASKLALGELGGETIVVPTEGFLVYDKSADSLYRYSGSAWVSVSGRWSRTDITYTSTFTWSKPPRLIGVEVVVTAASGGSYGTTDGGTGGFSAFGSFVTAAGGVGGTSGSTAGEPGEVSPQTWFDSADLGATELVQVGAGGAAGGVGGVAGSDGNVVVRQYIEA